MENTDQSLFDISFDENVKQNLKGAATWGGIAAIVSLIGSILGVVNFFAQRGKTSRLDYGGFERLRMQQDAQSNNLGSVIFTLIIGIILFVFLNKFSISAKAGVQASDQHLINEGLGSLSTYFRIIGVLLIIMIVLVGLGVLIGIGQSV